METAVRSSTQLATDVHPQTRATATSGRACRRPPWLMADPGASQTGRADRDAVGSYLDIKIRRTCQRPAAMGDMVRQSEHETDLGVQALGRAGVALSRETQI